VNGEFNSHCARQHPFSHQQYAERWQEAVGQDRSVPEPGDIPFAIIAERHELAPRAA
jgi:hypothetical protein